MRNVSASINRLRPTSTKSPKCLKKSVPMIGLETSAMRNVHVNALANPRSTCIDRSPKVQMDDPFAACSCISTEGFRRSSALGGKTLISAPVSMRYLNFDTGSAMVSKRLVDVRRSVVAANDLHGRFPLDGSPQNICWRSRPIPNGTSIAHQH